MGQGNLSNNAPKPRIEDVMVIACAYFGRTRADMTGPCRFRRIARPRQIAMAICRSDAGRTLSEIGRAFGGRDHTTVLHAERRIAELSETDIELALHVERIRSQVFNFIAPEGVERPKALTAEFVLRQITEPYRRTGAFFRQIGERQTETACDRLLAALERENAIGRAA